MVTTLTSGLKATARPQFGPKNEALAVRLGQYTLAEIRLPGDYDPGSNAPLQLSARVTNDDGLRGRVERSWEKSTDPAYGDTFVFEHSELDQFPKGTHWVPTIPEMVPGRGTPLETFLSLRLMNVFERLGANFSGRRLVRLRNVVNEESVLKLAQLMKRNKELPIDELVRQTHTYAYVSNSIVQSGGRTVRARVTGEVHTVRAGTFLGDHPNVAETLAQYELTPDDLVRYKYDVEFTVDPVSP